MERPAGMAAARAGGLHQTGIARALAAGLQCRPLAQTLRDTAAWAAHLAPTPP